MKPQREDFPLPDLLWEPTRAYWEAAGREELRIPRCNHCQQWTWYPKPVCPECEKSDFAWRRLSGRAKLFSYVVVRHAFLPQYRDLTPFVPALVVPEEAPQVRLATRILTDAPDEIGMDMSVRVVFQPLQFTGVETTVMAPFFRPDL